MNIDDIKGRVEAQRRFFSGGATLDVKTRIAALKSLRSTIVRHEADILEALRLDLGKSGFEGYMCEVGLVLSEIDYMMRNVAAYSRRRRVPTPIAQFAARSYVQPAPYGVALIISPWNYPFMLCVDPLVDAIAAGNTVVLKPSAYAPQTGEAVKRIVEEAFSPEYVTVVMGGRQEIGWLLDEQFDCIFFTGSQNVGKEVLRHAAERLIPVTLELGGKSPCIVDATADIALAARRIVFGKFLNCGQTCVAPDYVLCDSRIENALIDALCAEIAAQYGAAPLQNADYGRVVNRKHFERLLGLMQSGTIVCGGEAREEELRIAPTILRGVDWEDAVMREEIFGPLLPVLTYNSLNDAIARVEALPHPLALYYFTTDKSAADAIMTKCRFGGGCINDTIVHLATSEMGFGGVGASGMGAYHGKAGFDAFSHYKSIVDKRNWIDLPIRYQPYDDKKRALLRRFLK
ncbi:MAG: aldehyde dehydrogenase [Clostridia bacterium]|nr:aldehyde dehydrogenase [Clostridia bacterium]